MQSWTNVVGGKESLEKRKEEGEEEVIMEGWKGKTGVKEEKKVGEERKR